MNLKQKTVLLVSQDVSKSGHGKIYFENLRFHLRDKLNIKSFVPMDSELEANNYKASVGFKKLSREHYLKYGAFSNSKRGLDKVCYSIKFFYDLQKHLRKHDYDLVHILDGEYLALSWFLLRIKKKKKISIIYTFHTGNFSLKEKSISNLYKVIIKEKFNKALFWLDHAICHGDWIKQEIEKSFPSINKRITAVVYPSSEYSDYKKVSNKKSLKLPSDKIVLGSIGMIRKDKRIELALDIISRLDNRFVLLIAGSLSDYNEQDIVDFIKEKEIENKVITIFKYLDVKDFDNCFKSIDVLLSTHKTTFSSASGPVSDARAYGIPVVVPKGGQLEQYVNGNCLGRVCQQDTIESYKEAINDVVNNYTYYVDKSIHASNLYSWKSFSNRHYEIYLKVIDGEV